MKTKTALISIWNDSGEIKDREVLLVDGYPLYYYSVLAAKTANVFDEIYLLTSRSEISKMAKLLDIKEFHYDLTSNRKDLVKNFLEVNKCDHLIHINASAALIKPDTIAKFTKTLITDNNKSLMSVTDDFGKKINDIMWGFSPYIHNNKKGLFPINKLESLVADSQTDLFMVEACLRHLKRKENVGRHRFTNRIKLIDGNVIKVMKDDNVGFYTRDKANTSLHNLKDIINEMGHGSWCYQLIYNTDDQVGLICQQPNEGVRSHAHVTKDEWWIVIKGTFEWRLDNNDVITANEGELVYLPQGTVHSIVCISEESGVRLACGARDFEHIYV